MANGIPYKLQDITLGFITGVFLKILFSTVVLHLSVKLVGGHSSLKKSIVLATVMEALNLVVLPLFSSGILFAVLYVVIWLFLVIIFFEVSLWKAILISIAQAIITFLFALFSILALIATIVGTVILLR